MSKTAHTPGPWRVSFEGGTTQIRAASNESLMCDETYYPWVPENYADWYLIAAAPDLLKALEAFASHYPMGINPMLDDTAVKAHAAIAKAKRGY